MSDALKPTPALLCKIGSIIVHVDEFLSPHGHPFDHTAMQLLLDDPEVKEWLKEMNRLAMIPRKRLLKA